MQEDDDVSDVLDAIAVWIDLTARSGMVSADELIEQIHDRVDDDLGEVEEGILAAFETRACAGIAQREQAEASWPARTMNDRIDAAFDELNASGIIALQGAGYTMSDGWDEANDIAGQLPSPPRGAVFYHWQDLERGVRGEGVFLAYGAYIEGPGQEEAAMAIAREACAVLRRHEVPVTWNESNEERIFIEPFPWQRRYRPEP